MRSVCFEGINVRIQTAADVYEVTACVSNQIKLHSFHLCTRIHIPDHMSGNNYFFINVFIFINFNISKLL